MGRTRMSVRNGLAGALLMGALAAVAAQPAAPAAGQWRTYGGDLASTRYESTIFFGTATTNSSMLLAERAVTM